MCGNAYDIHTTLAKRVLGDKVGLCYRLEGETVGRRQLTFVSAD